MVLKYIKRELKTIITFKYEYNLQYHMTTLIATLGSGKGSWLNLFRLINAVDWERIILIANPFFSKSFLDKQTVSKIDKIKVITLDYENKSYEEAISELSKEIDKEVLGVEVALNLISGMGKEHMITLAAVLKAGFGIRLVDLENNEMKELSF